MAYVFDEKKYPRLALPIGKVKVPRFLYISLIVLIVLILVVGGVYFYLENFKKSTEVVNRDVSGQGPPNYIKTVSSDSLKITTKTSSEPIIDLSDSEIADKALNLLDKKTDQRGLYIENEICVNGVCDSSSPSNRDGFSVLDGEVRYKKGFSSNVVEDLRRYTDKSLVNVIQSDYLLCNFLYDLYNYPGASDEVKNLTKEICFNTQYELIKQDWDFFYGTGNSVDTTTLLNKNLERLENILINKKTISSNFSKTDFNILKNYGYFTSEFTTRYKWENKNNDYDGFLISLDRFLDLYGDEQNKFDDGENCGLALGLIDMGEYKQIPELKKYGEMVFTKEVKDVDGMNVRNMLTCGLVADRINNKEVLNKIINRIKINFYDTDKGYVCEQDNSSNIKVYNIRNNGIFLILLSGILEND